MGKGGRVVTWGWIRKGVVWDGKGGFGKVRRG